jgi:four helix bundle protein
MRHFDFMNCGIWSFGYLVIDLRIESSFLEERNVSTQSEALKERTITFAINALRLIDKFPDTPGAKVIGYQLAKSAPSVGANYRAVCNARSRAEFIARLGIIVEESEYWLLIVHRMRIVDAPEGPELLQEAVE